MSEEKTLNGNSTGVAPEAPACPHCSQQMTAWETPQLANWSSAYVWVCFNDECSYFQRGWDWMYEHYSVHASYRYKLDPFTGEQGPLPVWSKTALRSGILDDDKEESNR